MNEPSPVVRALLAPPTEDELAGEAHARAMFVREAHVGPFGHGLRLVSHAGLTLGVAAAVVSMTGVTAAAYTGALPHTVRVVAHRLLGRPLIEHHHHHASVQPRPVDLPPRVQAPVVARTAPVGSSPLVGARVTGGRAGLELVLETHDAGGTLWHDDAVTRLGDDGTGSAQLHDLSRTVMVRWVVRGASGDVAGPQAQVLAQPRVRRTLPTTPLTHGKPVTMTVTAGAEQAGRLLLVQQQVRGVWVTIAQARFASDGTAHPLVTIKAPGKVAVRVVVPGGPNFAEAATPVSVLQVH